MENRTRPYAYTFRASENERKIIDEKLKASSLTMTDFPGFCIVPIAVRKCI